MLIPQDHREYRKREFCNDVKCFVQLELNKNVQGSEQYEKIRGICSSACQFGGKSFENWLIENGFSLFKDGKSVDFANLEKEGADFSTAWKLHKWMTGKKYELVKKI